MEIFSGLIENLRSNHDVWDIWCSLLTGFLTVFFAAKSFFLEREIWKLNFFFWKAFITRMEAHPTRESYLRIMFVNTSNVVGYIDTISIEIEPIDYLSRIRTRITTSDIRRKVGIEPAPSAFLMPLWSLINKEEKSLFKNEYPPYKVLPQESKAIFIGYEDFKKNMSEELPRFQSRIKRFVFFTSSGTKIYKKISKKDFSDLFFSHDNL